MLVATVATNFQRSRSGHVITSAETGDCDDQISDAMSSAYQQLFLTGEIMDLDAVAGYQQQQQHQRQRHLQQPPMVISPQHAMYANSRPDEAAVAYLPQTLMPSGYPLSSPQLQRQQYPPSTQPRSVFPSSPEATYNSINMANNRLHLWQQRRPSGSPAADLSQQQRFFEDFQRRHNMQVDSHISSPGNPASAIEVPGHQQRQQAHVAYEQISSAHRSPQLDYSLVTTQQQHHHHHSMPPQLRNDSHFGVCNRDSSSRERELGGAPNMVGSDGMPEPALRPKGPKLKFTRDDDALLIELKEGKNLTWKQIADFFPGRSSGTLQVRYCTKLKAKTTVWTDDMVQRLRNAIAEYDSDRWRIIASKVGNGFSAVACQDRALELDIEERGHALMMGEFDGEDE